jgi:hypothetical protein
VLIVASGAQYSFGVALSALLDEFSWSRASLAGVFSIYAFLRSASRCAARAPARS